MVVDQCRSIHYGNRGSLLGWVRSGSNFWHGRVPGYGLGNWNARPAHSYWIGHCEHLKCVKTVCWLRAKVSFASVEKNPGNGPVVLAVWKGERSHDWQTSKTRALLIIYINIVRGANRLWGKTSMGRNICGVKCPSMGWSIHWVKCPRGKKSISPVNQP